MRSCFKARRTAKVEIAERVALEANADIRFVGIQGDVTEARHAEQLLDCDYIFLAADSMQARLVFNAIVHQYVIPGVQMGAKVQVAPETGEILAVFSVVRPMVPGSGCLWCNGLIDSAKLQEEATDHDQRQQQRYVEDDDIPDPSVITLNAVAAAEAVNDYMMSVTGLLGSMDLRWTKYFPRDTKVVKQIPRQDDHCPECSSSGRGGKGPRRSLPVRLTG